MKKLKKQTSYVVMWDNNLNIYKSLGMSPIVTRIQDSKSWTILVFQSSNGMILFWYRVDIQIYGVNRKLKVHGGKRWRKKRDNTTTSLSSMFVLHLECYYFNVILY